MVKNTFTISDSFPWLITLALLAVMLVLVFAYSEPIFFQAYGLAAAYLAFVGLAVRHYWDRYVRASAWGAAPKLTMGIPVFGNISETTIDRFDDVVIDAILFWIDTEKYKPKPETLAEVTITIVADPFTVSGVLAGGCVVDKDITVVGESLAGKEREGLLLRHELGHVVLSVLGYPVEKHQAIFDEVKYNC